MTKHGHPTSYESNVVDLLISVTNIEYLEIVKLESINILLDMDMSMLIADFIL